jgi:hypothetical protein
VAGIQVVDNTIHDPTASAIRFRCQNGTSANQVSINRNVVRLPQSHGIEISAGVSLGTGPVLFEDVSVSGNNLTMTGLGATDAIRWRSGIPVHPDPSHVSDSGLGRAVAETLGPHHALQIRAHGQVIAAESVRAVLVDSIHFVENAVTMYHAAALGKVRALSPADMDAFAVAFKRDPHISKLWTYYLGIVRANGRVPADWAID